jgi:Icc-related predicted phosphoesterase
MVKILAVGDPHGSEKIKKIPNKGFDFVLLTGDLGKADFARKFFFDNLERKREGLPEKDYSKKEAKATYKEIADSTLEVIKYFSKNSSAYSILGNVGTSMVRNSEVRKEEKKYGIKLPYLKKEFGKLENFSLVRNRMRKINGLRVGFLEYFVDTNWVQDFRPPNYKDRMKKAKEETEKARKILKGFGKIDILVCHQPPYGVLDKVSGKYGAPKDYVGKHAGSKAILAYIKKFQPKYVFCGHIHEGEGMKKIGKTEVYNLGVAGHKIISVNP